MLPLGFACDLSNDGFGLFFCDGLHCLLCLDGCHWDVAIYIEETTWRESEKEIKLDVEQPFLSIMF
jgi:hypothetical protein